MMNLILPEKFRKNGNPFLGMNLRKSVVFIGMVCMVKYNTQLYKIKTKKKGKNIVVTRKKEKKSRDNSKLLLRKVPDIDEEKNVSLRII